MSKKKKVIISQKGHCPHCGSNSLNYDDYNFNADSVIFNYACKECSFLGYEEYSCQFIGHSDTYGHQFWYEGDNTKDE